MDASSSRRFKLSSIVSQKRQINLFQLAWDAPEGALVEVGVFRGGTATVLYSVALQQGRDLFLYDTFSGMPFCGPHDVHPVGDFANTDAENIRQAMPRAVVIVGTFPATFTPVGKIAFVHADADQYQSTLDICNTLKPHMATGGLMVFDDWSLAGCRKALLECFGEPTEMNKDEQPIYRF